MGLWGHYNRILFTGSSLSYYGSQIESYAGHRLESMGTGARIYSGTNPSICGKWFLTTNARHTKYCGGFAPGDKLGRTCRQIGNLRGREQRELAPAHPIKKIYNRRMNTIDKKLDRGMLDQDAAAAMKRLAKRKMQQAISDVAYAQGSYAAEMEQTALLAEAKAEMKR